MLVLLPLILLKQSLKHTDTQEAFLEGYVLKYRESGGRKFKFLDLPCAVPYFISLCVFQGRKNQCSHERRLSTHWRCHAQEYAYSKGKSRIKRMESQDC